VELVFREWLDTRRLPLGGQSDQTNDLVADGHFREQPDRRCAVLVEFQTEPDPDIAERLGVYGLLVRREERFQPGQDGKREVVAVVVNLTGAPEPPRLELPFPGVPDCGIMIRPWQRNLETEDAETALAEIEAGKMALCMLPWVPLMRGSDQAPVAERWKELLQREPDQRKQAEYLSLARTFVELTPALVLWQRTLEGMNVRESQFANELMQEGALREARRQLTRLLRGKFRLQEVPQEIALAIEGTNAKDLLDR
jgi:hypothetical protein